MTEDTVKALVIKENVWECQLCRNAESSCPVCKVKEREIRNLKKNITELESNTEHLNSEMKVNYERITDLEDRLTREKKLRKRLDKDLEELRQEFDQLSKLKEKRKRSVSTSSSCDTCDSCSSSDESDRDGATMERERKKVVRKTRKAKRRKDKHGKVKAHESEDVAVKERQRINHLKPQTENGGESGGKRQECRTTLSNGSDTSKYDELRDICDSEVEEEISNESYRMAINYLQKYSAQEAGNAPRSSHSRPRPRTTCSPNRRKVRGNSFGFEGDNGKSDSFVLYASDVNDNQRTLRSDINLLGDNTTKIQLRQGYYYQFQKTGACTKVNCKFMHVNSNLSYPNRSHVTDHLSKPKPNRQWKPRHAQNSRVRKRVCFNFMNNKFRKYGDNCKFLHSKYH